MKKSPHRITVFCPVGKQVAKPALYKNRLAPVANKLDKTLLMTHDKKCRPIDKIMLT